MNRFDLIPPTVIAACVLHNLCIDNEPLSEKVIQEGLTFLDNPVAGGAAGPEAAEAVRMGQRPRLPAPEDNSMSNDTPEALSHNDEGLRRRDELASRLPILKNLNNRR